MENMTCWFYYKHICRGMNIDPRMIYLTEIPPNYSFDIDINLAGLEVITTFWFYGRDQDEYTMTRTFVAISKSMTMKLSLLRRHLMPERMFAITNNRRLFNIALRHLSKYIWSSD